MRACGFALAFLILFTPTAWGGCACPAYIELPHLSFHAGDFQHCRLDTARLLRAKGLAILLEEQVAARSARGSLAEKKVRIDGCQRGEKLEVTCPSFEVIQDSEAYWIEGGGELDPRDLVRTLDYFATRDLARVEPEASGAGLSDYELRPRDLMHFLEILDRTVPEPDLKAFHSKRLEVFRVGELAAFYQDGKLSLEIAGQHLDLELGALLPAQVGTRYLVQTGDSLLVLEGGQVLASHPVPQGPYCDTYGWPWAVAREGSLDLYCGQTIVLRYELEANRFTAVEIEREHAPDAHATIEPSLGVRFGPCG